MSLTHWLKNLKAKLLGTRPTQPLSSARKRSARLAVESLEDRITPSHFRGTEIDWSQVSGEHHQFPGHAIVAVERFRQSGRRLGGQHRFARIWR